jgi:hypothetical protein
MDSDKYKVRCKLLMPVFRCTWEHQANIVMAKKIISFIGEPANIAEFNTGGRFVI